MGHSVTWNKMRVMVSQVYKEGQVVTGNHRSDRLSHEIPGMTEITRSISVSQEIQEGYIFIHN